MLPVSDPFALKYHVLDITSKLFGIHSSELPLSFAYHHLHKKDIFYLQTNWC